ncbi:MAG: family 20 glycosylhydrolase [Candidatus Delongbacteria bacterium]|nr:family 20 glycosylhydrolase [Candidatus Delongbacteria bacterium]MBN2834258.1 family 20 glycosylhydrolase [Candidatus Delongbacteria bacterium]
MIPIPKKNDKIGIIDLKGRVFKINCDSDFRSFFEEYANIEGLETTRNETSNVFNINFYRHPFGNSEQYGLKIEGTSAEIKYGDYAGAFYGLISFINCISFSIDIDRKPVSACVVDLSDYPDFKWRGMHLDVSRHFFNTDFIKKYIDILAHYKMNIFHWHLTDDNGWRIEIKKYPKLQEIAAWRASRSEDWMDRKDQKPDEKADYGGFYTQDEIKSIIEYAEQRGITIVPEIEMPGHTREVLAAYPKLGCFDEKLTVPTGTYWPNKDIFCAGKESVFEFIFNVLDEVIDLFPSEYIHIGGDEAGKMNWEKCPLCSARIKSENLKDVEELQSYFIKRVEKYINSKGRKLIGWDEILEGGLAPNAAVMSWQGIEGGIKAANMGHNIVMTPSGITYFDHYQNDPSMEPKAIGGFNSIYKIFNYNPIPEQLEQNREKVMGIQGCLWTEWVPNEKHAEYMLLPRVAAIGEIGWNGKQKRDWNCFLDNLEIEKKYYLFKGYNFAKGSYVPLHFVNFDDNQCNLTLFSELKDSTIFYKTTDDYVMYEKPIVINNSCKLKFYIIDSYGKKGPERELDFNVSKSFGKEVTYKNNWSYRYPSTKEFALVDGLTGSPTHTDGCWQGFQNSDMEVTIDLGEITDFNSISLNFLQNKRIWIFLPRYIDITLSIDNISFDEIKRYDMEDLSQDKIYSIMENGSFKARYIKIFAKSRDYVEIETQYRRMPWIFCDQISVN